MAISPFEADEGLLRHLAERGLQQSRFISVLYGVPAPTQPPPRGEVTVRAFQAPDLDLFLTLWRAGAPETDWEFLNPIGRAEFADWWCYVGFVGSEPAGIAGLYVRDGVGVMASGATLPDFRGRGCQTALLHQRLVDAAMRGCDLVLSQGRPGSGSQRNIERVGLHTAYTHAIWIDQPDGPTRGGPR